MDKFHKMGGLQGLSKALCTDLDNGVDASGSGPGSVEQLRQTFGANKFKATPPKSFLTIVWAAVQDPILILLIFAATVSATVKLAVASLV